jgi:PhzF family phenazine biosynthesis protein
MTTHPLPFFQVDVFSASATQPFTGNPVAVVMDAENLSAARMQQIAIWTNLSETTFVSEISPQGYRLRIFTPGGELPFAGHPSLGSAWAVCQHLGLSGETIALTQRCAVGDVAIEIGSSGAKANLKLPPASLIDISSSQSAALSNALGCEMMGDPKIVDLGPRWLTLPVSSAESLLAIKPDLPAIAALSRSLSLTGVNVFGPNEAAGYEVRSFAPAAGIAEDPVCGSGNGAVAYYLRDVSGFKLASYEARQGRAIGRDGRISITYKDQDIWLGGICIVSVRGVLNV